MPDTIYDLRRFFEEIDSTKRWSIEPDEAVEITLSAADTYLNIDDPSDYCNFVTVMLDGVGYERLGKEVISGFSGDEEDRLFKILGYGEYGYRKKGK